MKTIFTLCFTFAFLITQSVAQNRNDVIGLGMGRSSVASSQGIDALWSNPANLISNDSTAKAFSLSLTPVGLMAGNSIIAMNDVQFYFGGTKTTTGKTTARVLNNTERDEFLNKLTNGTIAGSVNVSGLALVYTISQNHSIGFSHNTIAEFQANIPSAVSQIIAGYTGFKPLTITDVTANALIYNSYQVSYATVVKNNLQSPTESTIRFGINAKYIQGLYYASADNSNTISVKPFVPTGWDSTKNWDIVINTTTRTAGINTGNSVSPTSFLYSDKPNGTGVGFDIGSTFILPEVFELPLLVSASFTDIGFISWHNASINTTTSHDTIKALAQIDESVLDRYTPITTSSSFTTSLSTRLRVGASTMFNNVFGQNDFVRCAFEYTQGFNSVGVNTTTPRVSAGAELLQNGFRPALRIGSQIGGIEGSMITAGFGWNILHTVSFDVAVGSLQTVLSPKTSKWIDGGFRLRVDL